MGKFAYQRDMYFISALLNMGQLGLFQIRISVMSSFESAANNEE